MIDKLPTVTETKKNRKRVQIRHVVNNVQQNKFEKIDKYIDNKMDWSKTNASKTKPRTPLFPKFSDSNNCNSNNHNIKSKLVRFQRFDNLMESVRKQYVHGRYSDTITKMKEKQRSQKQLATILKSTCSEENGSDSNDEQMYEREFMESILYNTKRTEINSTYWSTCAVLQYLKICNYSGTLLGLNILNKTDVKDLSFIKAFNEFQGNSLLLNILRKTDSRCKVIVLKIMRKLCELQQNCAAFIHHHGVFSLITCLTEVNSDVKCLAAEIISIIAVNSLVRTQVRQANGVPYLIHLMDISLDAVSNPDTNRLSLAGKVAQSAATAMWAISKSKQNRLVMQEAGIFPLLSRLLSSQNPAILIPIIGMLQQCSNEQYYKVSIRTEGLVFVIVNHLFSNYVWLKIQCALTLFSCADDAETRSLLKESGSLDRIIESLANCEDTFLTYGLTGIVWKCCQDQNSAKYFYEKGLVKIVFEILKALPQCIFTRLSVNSASSERLKLLKNKIWIAINVTGVLSELAGFPKGRKEILANNGVDMLISLLPISDRLPLLINTVRTLGKCAVDAECSHRLVHLGGVRRIMSLLKHQRPEAQSAAGWALVHCFENVESWGIEVSSFVGFLETLVSLLESSDEEVLCATCACISILCREDTENLHIISDLPIVARLTRLASANSGIVIQFVAPAIGDVARIEENTNKFLKAGAVGYLVQHFDCVENEISYKLDQALAYAFVRLSKDPLTCLEMYRLGLCKMLLKRSKLKALKNINFVFKTEMARTLTNIRKVVASCRKSDKQQTSQSQYRL